LFLFNCCGVLFLFKNTNHNKNGTAKQHILKISFFAVIFINFFNSIVVQWYKNNHIFCLLKNMINKKAYEPIPAHVWTVHLLPQLIQHRVHVAWARNERSGENDLGTESKPFLIPQEKVRLNFWAPDFCPLLGRPLCPYQWTGHDLGQEMSFQFSKFKLFAYDKILSVQRVVLQNVR
jgi:hypothetical protein